MAESTSVTQPPRLEGVGGWLLILCRLFIVWGPVQLAFIVSSALAALSVRGSSLGLMIIARMLVTAFGLAAGLALQARRGSAVTMARASLVLTAASDSFVYLTSYFPSNVVPGDEWLYVGATLLYAVVWLLYLARSRRVRNTFG